MLETYEHQFGGNWTLIKLDALKGYLVAFNTALKDKPSIESPFYRMYIDAFAGSGECSISINEVTHNCEGSAKIALNVEPSFDEFLFIDKKQKHIDELSKLGSNYPDKKIRLFQDDCNIKIRELLSEFNWRKTRAVLFLDPYGMSVEWGTLKAIAKTEAIDLWYLFPLNAVIRQAANNFNKVDEMKKKSLNKLFGDDTWIDYFYKMSPQISLFDNVDEQLVRDADYNKVLSFFKDKLCTIFPNVLTPLILHANSNPYFALFFASSNPSEKSIILSKKIAGHLLKMK